MEDASTPAADPLDEDLLDQLVSYPLSDGEAENIEFSNPQSESLDQTFGQINSQDSGPADREAKAKVEIPAQKKVDIKDRNRSSYDSNTPGPKNESLTALQLDIQGQEEMMLQSSGTQFRKSKDKKGVKYTYMLNQLSHRDTHSCWFPIVFKYT